MNGLLLITRHYPPDSAALAYRMKHAAEVLSHHQPVTVLTSQPSRYSDAGKEISYERAGEVEVRRIWNGQISKSRGKAARALGELVGALWMTCFALLRCRGADIALVSSPPFAFLLPGWALHKVFGIPLVVDVRDLWLDWAEEIHLIRSELLLRVMRRFERSVLESAQHITVATNGFKRELVDRFAVSPERITVIYNGLDGVVDPSITAPDRPAGLPDENSQKCRILYAGNLGPSQNIAGIIAGLSRSAEKWPELEITIVGDGLQRGELLKWQGGRMHILERVDRRELGSMYASADAFLLHLADLHVYRHTVPSKIFEYAAYGKPVLCGVHGEARELCARHADCFYFDSDDSPSLESAIDRIMSGSRPDNATSSRAHRSLLFRSARASLWENVLRPEGRCLQTASS